MLSDKEATKKIKTILKRCKLNLVGGFIAGGFVRDCLLNEPFNDIDIWYFNKKFKPKKQLWDSISVNCTSQLIPYIDRTIIVQHMHKTGTVEEILGNFDFTCCMVAYIPESEKLVYLSSAKKDLKNRILKVNSVNSPFSSVCRVFKFIERGFTIDDEELSKLLIAYDNTMPLISSSTSDGGEKWGIEGLINQYTSGETAALSILW